MTFLARRVLTIFALLFVGLIAFGQKPSVSPEEAQIRQFREEIQRLAAKSPPPELQDAHRAALHQLRSQLRDLLLEKKGALKKDLRDLQASNTSSVYQSYVKQLGDAIRKVDNEIQSLQIELDKDTMVASNIAPTVAPPSPSPEPSLSPAPSPSPALSPENAREQPLRTEDTSAATPSTSSVPDQIVVHDCNLVLLDTNLKTYTPYEQGICFVARNVVDRKKGDPLNPRNKSKPDATINLSKDQLQLLKVIFGKYIKSESRASFLLEAEEARTDKQLGSDPLSSGTTSLIAKGGVPSFLNWAVENGAAVASTTGTTITFRFNPIGTLDMLSNKGYITGYREDEGDAIRGFLRNTALGISFDASRGKDPGTLTANKQQVSALSFRYQFVNQRDPRAKRYQKDWEQFIATQGIAFTNTASKSLNTLEEEATDETTQTKFKDKALQAWLDKTNQLIAEINDVSLNRTELISRVQRVIVDQLAVLPVKQLSPETIAALDDFANGLQGYLKSKKDILDKIAKGRVISFEYVNHREVNAPDLSTFNFIAEGGTGRRIDLTANAWLTMFNKKPAGANIGRIRDFQFAAQLDIPVNTGFGQSVLSFTGRYERLVENASTQVGTIVPNSKGAIGYGQVKLMIPIKGSGFKIPFSVTFSNRTELIKQKEIRGNFGFTLDLDSIFAKFKPF